MSAQPSPGPRGFRAIRPVRRVARRWLGMIVPRFHVPEDLDAAVRIGPEDRRAAARLDPALLADILAQVEALIRTGLYPALQFSLHHRGRPILERAFGHVRGIKVGERNRSPGPPITVDTPITLFSASKAITGLIVLKVAEAGVFSLGDCVSRFIPRYASHGKADTTLEHLLDHRAGIPRMPPRAMAPDLMGNPTLVTDLLCRLRPRHRPGDAMAYHASTSGYVLAEVVLRTTGLTLRQALRELITGPIGLEHLDYGVPARRMGTIPFNSVTGFPVPPFFRPIFRGALGLTYEEFVDVSNDPAFMTGILPSLNVMASARDMTRLYDHLLLAGPGRGSGRGRGRPGRVFSPELYARVAPEERPRTLDRTAWLPLCYSPGHVLGGRLFSIYGPRTPRAFGHLGFTNIFCWADPDREISVALLTSGKPFLGPHLLALARFFAAVSALPTGGD